MPAISIRAFAVVVLAGTALTLAACSVKTHGDNGEDASITIGNGASSADPAVANGQQGVSIDVPGFSAKVNVPDLDIGGDTKIEDMPMFPGTKVNGVNIVAHGNDGSGAESKGDVTMAFTAPGDPAKIVAWYKDQADKNGWDAVPPSDNNQFEATKRDGDHGPTHFALQVASATGGSNGHFIVTGR
jgi:hypothetical protein